MLISISLLILFLPLLSFLILIFFGKKLPRQGDWLGTAILIICLGLAFYVLLNTGASDKFNAIYNWIDLKDAPGFGPVKINLGILIDNLSAIMLVVVCLISAAAHLFSTKYMEGDAKYNRYYAYLGIFTFSMLGIVLTDNLLMMYIFWELVGLTSYLLIGFWYENPGPQYASKKAFIVNRIGDVGFFTGIMIVYVFTKSFTFSEIFAAIEAGQLTGGWLTAAGILIFCGAIGKSAQFPLHVWLPDAMEGPTPVSALIHAATMVAAGVYLVTRTFPMMSASALTFIAYIGLITAFISATIAITQNDIKKVLAYSTVSQLGFMIMALGVGAYTAGFFHLVTHAAFKACLFLGAGSVIYGMHHEQDIRNMGGLKKKMRITYLTFLMATMALSGVPLTSGFLSKDSILAGTMAFAGLTGGFNYIIPILAFLSAGMTAFYMFRLVFLTFHGEPKNKEKFDHVKESPLPMTIPLIVLSVLSFFVFFSYNPIDANIGWFAKYVPAVQTVVPEAQRFDFQKGTTEHIVNAESPASETHGENPAAVEENHSAFTEAVHHAHYPAMGLSLFVAGMGILLAFAFYKWKKFSADAVAEKIKPLYTFSLNKWYFDEFYEGVIVKGLLMLTQAFRWFDNKVVDGVVNGAAYVTERSSSGTGKFDNSFVDGLVNLIGSVVMFFGLIFRKIQTGRIQTYLAYVLFGIILFYFIFRTM
ncbi:MAG: NADH-quinone oxidoreductase subunit L [Ignavibacteriae bacterium]|nr:MAG: NADH-quinone oxidoreductase subunit L [Ignavibacteriota bacterium]